MKKVLVPLRIMQDARWGTADLYFVQDTYIKKLLKYNLVPIFIPAIAPQEVVDELYSLCSGVMCIGGHDFDSALYGADKHPKTDVAEARRDELEIPLIKRALADKKPFLGICRGAQALAIAAGGSLCQHVPDVVPLTVEDHGNTDGKVDQSVFDRGHEAYIIPSTKLHKLVGKENIIVHCAHHQSIKEPGADMITSAKSPAGIVEAIEHKDSSYFCFGVQSHPETQENSDLDVLFAEFAKAV